MPGASSVARRLRRCSVVRDRRRVGDFVYGRCVNNLHDDVENSAVSTRHVWRASVLAASVSSSDQMSPGVLAFDQDWGCSVALAGTVLGLIRDARDGLRLI
ncbi:hypothetical protein HPP92_021082 [Vanilla planifolia]|uniref:Uncharacterized protein n=1 Tax=Vanilla planifolia TaxID=51239 RepID=A0A835PY17_VANPL|nr:hypothetical protein HPP92_021082 [Vanilla planifolia]